MSVENQETSFEELQKEFSFDLPPSLETPPTPVELPTINLE